MLTTECAGRRLDQLLEQVDQGSQVVAVDPIQITEDIAVPRRDSDLTAWVRPSCPSMPQPASRRLCWTLTGVPGPPKTCMCPG